MGIMGGICVAWCTGIENAMCPFGSRTLVLGVEGSPRGGIWLASYGTPRKKGWPPCHAFLNAKPTPIEAGYPPCFAIKCGTSMVLVKEIILLFFLNTKVGEVPHLFALHMG